MSQEKRLVMQAAERVLGVATKDVPDGEIFVAVRQGRDANTRFAVNTITTTGDVEETHVSVRVALGKRHARVSTNQTDEAELRAVINHAARMARIAPEDPESMPVLGPQTIASIPAAFDAPTADLAAPARAASIKTAIDHAKSAGLVSAGFYSHSATEVALASSAGLRAWYATTDAGLGMTMRTPDGTGSGWAASTSQRASDIDATALAQTAADKALKSQKPRALDPGLYTVVLEPAAVGALLGFLPEAFDARGVDEGRSYFSKAGGGSRLGETIFPATITLESNPLDPETPWPPCDDEGLPLAPFKWIDQGKIAAFEYSRYWASKKGAQPTGDRPVGKLWGGTAASIDELVSGVKRGLLITRFWYLRTLDVKNVVATGLTRDGVFLIEDGKITTPVKNFRFNESPITMLTNADAMTKATVRVQTEDSAGVVRVPAIRTHDFNLASVSEAV